MMKPNPKIVAFVLVNVRNEISTDEITSKLDGIPEIVESTAVLGTYNLILKIEAEKSSQIRDITLRSIRTIKGVIKTVTLISFESWDQ